MITLLKTFLIVYGAFGLWFVYFMLNTKPRFKENQGNRFMGNWREGGRIIFWACTVVCAIVSLALTGIILSFNFLENH